MTRLDATRPFTASPRFIKVLLHRVLSLAERSPKLGWSLILIGFDAARRTDDPALLAEATWTLGAVLNLREQFPKALAVLRRAQRIFAQQNDAEGVARCQWQQGIALRFQTHLVEAEQLLQEALAAVESLGLAVEAARARRDLAIAYNLLERFDDAKVLITNARAFFAHKSQLIEVARCDLVIGSQLRQLTQYQDALQIFESALRTFQSAGQAIEQAKILHMMGLVHAQLRAYEEALSYQQEAERIFLSADLPLRTAYCNLAQGRLLWRLGKSCKARTRIEKAQAWFECKGMPRDTADCLLNLGNIAYIEGNYDLAEATYGQARRYYDRLGLGVYTARCDQNLGLVHYQQGQLGAALDRLHRAADVLEKRDVLIWAADCHYKMAEIYSDLQQQETALLHLEHALPYYSREGIALGEAQCEVLKARIIGQEGERPQALQTLERARRAAAATGSSRYVALCSRLIGDLLLEWKQFSGALQQYEAAQGHFAKAGAMVDEALCQVGMGQAYAQSGQLDHAEEALLIALQTTAGALPELSWRAKAELGHVALSRGDNQRALRCYQGAIEALHRIRFTLPEAELAGGLVASCRVVYDQAVRLALEQGEYVQALEIAEESKAQVLERMVRSAVSRETMDPYVDELLGREVELRSAITLLRWQLICSFENRTEPPLRPVEDSATLLDSLRVHRSEYRRVLQQLHAADSRRLETVESFEWERFCVTAEKMLLPGWSALIYYWLDEQLIIFHVDNQDVRTYVRQPSRVEQAALETCTSPAPERRTLVFQGNLYGEAPPSPIGPTYRRLLYNLLIPEKAAESLASDKPLLIVPYSRLHYLPFQALENEAGFLAEQAVVSYVPSLGVLEGLLQRRMDYDREQRKNNKALLVGIDNFHQPKPMLRWTLKEVDRLAAIYGKQSDCLRNKEATLETLKAWSKQDILSHYATFHFASHAYLEPASGILSGIALWDEDLTTEEISRLRLGPAMVILSACQSGLGKIHIGDEIVSLPYAFFAAGAQAVVVSLWHVEDESVVELMEAFHCHLNEQVSPAIALAQAQREAIQHGSLPYTWGAFATMGIP